jgi:hypothetical protein
MSGNNIATSLVTFRDSMRRYTKREVTAAERAREFLRYLGHATPKAVIDMIRGGMLNCPVTETDIQHAEAIFGPSIASLKGKTVKCIPMRATAVLAPRVTQQEHILVLDIVFVESLSFLLGKLVPLGLLLVSFVPNRSAEEIAPRIKGFLNKAASRGFRVFQCRADKEGGIESMRSELANHGVDIQPCASGQHVPEIERANRVLKERVRCHIHGLPYLMCRTLLVMCVYVCVATINWQRQSTSVDKVSPNEQFQWAISCNSTTSCNLVTSCQFLSFEIEMTSILSNFFITSLITQAEIAILKTK